MYLIFHTYFDQKKRKRFTLITQANVPQKIICYQEREPRRLLMFAASLSEKYEITNILKPPRS